MSIQSQAMLMNLSISQWSARKFDRKATETVEQAHGAKDAGRFNKLLIDQEALKPIATAAGKLRDLHYRLTQPWDDNGARLLPSKLYFDYTRRMGAAKIEFEKAANDFFPKYPQLVQDARKRAGTLYNPADYPPVEEVKRKFAVAFSALPVPAANDFRVDVGNEEAERIKAEITAQVQARTAEAIKHNWRRVHEVAKRYSDTLHRTAPRIYDSMVDDCRELAIMLPALNLTDDPALTDITTKVQLLGSTAANALRVSSSARSNCAKLADEIMRAVPHDFTEAV
jgi:hypothetical protein